MNKAVCTAALKRGLDVTVAAAALLLLSPLLLLIVGTVGLSMGAPLLFRQSRPGRGGQLFTIYKFRTMRPQNPTAPLSDAERITPVGRLLRLTSLDELPQLWNVLKGDMSLVGPRPLLPEYLSRYSTEQARRHEVRPGITGWAQVNGRNTVTWDEKLKMDVWYVDHCSLWLDFKILLWTVYRVVRRDNVALETEFWGTLQPSRPPCPAAIEKGS